jgi:alpha-acetolactate decarboxylase
MTSSRALYQYSTASALMAGVAGTGIRLSELLSHGNYGLGTMVNIDGEVVVIDGITYHMQPSGSIRTLDAGSKLPFAMIAHLATDDFHSVAGLQTKQSIQEYLLKLYPGATNRFMVFLIEGRFDTMTTRVVQGQRYSGQPLSELGDQQRVTRHCDVQGTVVGFSNPSFIDGVSVSGLHAHFLSADKTFGGHVLELKSEGTIRLVADVLSSFILELPDNKDFDKARLELGGEALRKVEG